MHPHEAKIGHLRKYTTGERYLLREDGYVMPRAISSHEVPKGFQAVIAQDEYTLVPDTTPTEHAADVRDARTLPGSAISFNAGHVKAPSASVPVSNPYASDDHQTRERIVASQTQISEVPDAEKTVVDSTQRQVPTGGRRGRKPPDLSKLVPGA